MITLEKLEIYEKFAGDVDHLQRVGSHEEKQLFETNSDWFEITNFKQDMFLISQNLTSKKYKDLAFERIRISCDDNVFKLLNNLSKAIKSEIDEQPLKGKKLVEKTKTLKKIKTDETGWNTYYVDENLKKWICEYPDSGYHGGGSPQLRLIEKFPWE